MIDRVLKTHLEPIARDQRRWQLGRALNRGWLLAALIGLCFVGLRLVAGWTSPWVFLLLAFATLAWTLAICYRSWRRQIDYQGIARKIEAENPQLHKLLLTAVEQQPDPATGELNYLQARVIHEALAHDLGNSWGAPTSQRLIFTRLANLFTFLLLACVLASLYQAAPPSVALRQLAGTQGVSVTPGDATVEKGSSLVVLARFEGEVPKEATLVVRPANEAEQRIPLVKNLDDPVFGASLSEVKGELTYRVEYAGNHTRDFKVGVFEYPRLERADAKISYPDYTGLPEKTIENTRRVSAVEGSALDYTFHLNKPVRSAKLVEVRSRQGNEAGAKKKSAETAPPPDVGGYIELQADTNQPNIYTSNFKLEKSRRYELVLTDEAGRTNKLPAHFVFEALTNRAPELKFAFPRGDQRVSALEEIAFKAEASDDFGLKAYGLAYNLAGHETKFVELGTNATAHEKRAFDQLVPLEDMDAQPDQLLSYYVWADDVGPDGNVRRTSSDMFFAEVRPFEEIFREGQAPSGGQQQQQQRQGGQSRADRLAELQKQIINATWNLQRREGNKTPSPAYKPDATTVKESQDTALEQAQAQREQMEDARSIAFMETAEKEMERAATLLASAADDNSLKPLPDALSAEQSAYQALLRLAAREHQVSRGQRGQQGQSGRGQRAQRQLDQLDLKQTENRYETQREAAPPQSQQQREQLQAFNRLKELAQRQQDVNERLKELQAALKEAKTEAERQELRDRLKRLQEEQQQLLADVDELRQRMERPENQSQMAEARQQLEETRSEVQQTSEAMNQGDVSQALSSGTRAQRDLQQLRDDFRKRSSSQFADDMREMRNQARELAQREESIGQKIETLNQPTEQKTLTDSDERKEIASQLDEQKKRLEELTKHATEVTEKAESVEPLLSRQLYDTLRKASQDDARDLQETTTDLLTQGRLLRPVYDRLQSAKEGSKKTVEVAADLLREGFPSEAKQLEQRARRSINELKGGVERAAQSVLGDDTEALRLAQREVEDLAEQIQKEIAQAANDRGTNSARTAQASTGERREQGANRGQTAQGGNAQNESQQPAEGQQGQRSQQPGESQQQAQNQDQQGQGRGQQNGERQAGEQPGQQPGQSQQQTASSGQQGNGGGDRDANSESQRERDRTASRDGQREGGRNILERFGGDNRGGWDGGWGGPLTGPEYTQWSDRLRDVEEMLDVPDLRTEAARIRDRAGDFRLNLKRHANPPEWDLVQVQIAGPLVELRARIAEELARRESKEALVPIDRDPVPTRYSELVRKYYEELGKSEPSAAKGAGGGKQ
jgi:hypothetical protein